jgi:hypothetical protein
LSCNVHCIQQRKLICMFRCLVVHMHSNVIRSPVISCLAWLQLCWSCNTVNPEVMFLLPETCSLYSATMLHHPQLYMPSADRLRAQWQILYYIKPEAWDFHIVPHLFESCVIIQITEIFPPVTICDSLLKCIWPSDTTCLLLWLWRRKQNFCPKY